MAGNLLWFLYFIGGGLWGATIAVIYLRWLDSREHERFGDYVYKRYEDSKVTHVAPMTAEQRAAADKVFADIDKVNASVGKMFYEAFTRTP